ncbi:MAG: repeat protein [Verrucomicrobiales bacterium]|nr:repeat protein [Verrucomicrobiales bacterium]
MKHKFFAFATLFVLLATAGRSVAQGTAFTYQGRLNDGASVANGLYDLRFKIFDTLTNGTQQGPLLTGTATPVSNGLLTVTLDFGNQFPGTNRWLEIDVRTNGIGAFTTLSPRQPLSPTPYAIYSGAAATANSVSAANIVGTVPIAQLPSNLITNGSSGVNFTGTFSGNGSGVTNINLAANSGGALTISGGFPLTSMPTVGNGPRSVAATDVNGDGKIDLISANYGTNGTGNTLSILTNNGTGVFTLSSTPVVGVGPISVIATDVNGDNKMDLVCANYKGGSNNTLSILINNGTGGFTLSSSPVVGAGPVSVIAADVNGDGKMDLITANLGGGSAGLGTTLSVLTNTGTGSFALSSTVVVGLGPMAIVATDINGDNKLDLVSANFYASSISVVTNTGNGNFVLSSSIAGLTHANAIVAMDVNNDGKMDLITSDPANDLLQVLTNNGTGAFAISSSPSLDSPYNSGSATSIATADVNGDGKLDLICGNSFGLNGNTLSLLTNNGAGGFVLEPLPVYVGRGPYSTIAADVSGDGRPDLICANFGTNTLSVLFNSPTVTGIVQSTGPITSPMWNASIPIDYGGSLPSTGQFSTGGGTLLITPTGSGYTTVAGQIGMSILLDGVYIGSCQIYANQINSHMAFVSKTLVQKGVPAGPHSISLQATPGTLSNFDFFSVTVVEIPF